MCADIQKSGYEKYRLQLARLEASQENRNPGCSSSREGVNIEFNEKTYINLSSNDYLGIASDKELHREFYNGISDADLLDNFGLGSSSSRLLTGNHFLNIHLEEELMGLYHRSAALVFSSGYHANIGILPVIASKGDLILSDQLNHSSIIDGIRLSNAECIVYDHVNYKQLDLILQEKRKEYGNVIIVSETIFSMDGDLVDLPALIEIKNRHKALLYVDEAHAFGVRGNEGLGLCDEQQVVPEVDIILGTFGKAMGSQGAFGIMDKDIRQLLINKMRSLVYTTALPPVVLNWNLFILKKLPDFQPRRKKLNEIRGFFREILSKNKVEALGETHIVPIVCGSNDLAINLALRLQASGLLVLPIRPPTVPDNQSRIRISLTASIRREHLAKIPGEITAYFSGINKNF